MSTADTRVIDAQSPQHRRKWSKDEPTAMRIVLLGRSVSENSRVGNFLLGRVAFDSEAPPDVVERVGGRLKDRHVTVTNSPQLLQTNISDHHITQKVRECVYLTNPGPHVIVLILKHDQCSAEDQECVEKVLHSFSERVYQHTIVLTTQEPSETNDNLHTIIQKCCNRHFSLQRSSSPDDLLQRFEDIVQMNDGRHLICAEDEASQYFTAEQEVTERFSEIVKLNVVVCGSDGKLKSSISERILQETGRRLDVELHGRLINLVELPALFNTHLSEEEVMHQALHSVSLCDPGVHVFLLIIPDAPLTDEVKAEIEEIQKIFSSRINKHVMILIMQNSERQTAEFNEEIQSVTGSFGGRHHYFGPTTQVSTLMENIEKMLEENRGEFFSRETFLQAQMKKLLKYEEMKKKINLPESHVLSKESEDNLRIVLLGKTGVGKSSTGNTILGKEVFKAEISQESNTKVCQRETSDINGQIVTVIDTPGLFDTELTNEEIQREISNCIPMILPGPHVFIIVLNLGQRFTQEEATSVKIIQETFGENSLMYTMVLFTRGDDLKNKTIDQCLGKPGSALMNLIEVCGNRYHVFNNNQPGDRTQVSDLLEKIDAMVNANGGSFYSCKMFRQMEREKQEQQMKILIDRAEQLNREREELMNKHAEEKKRMKMMMEEERQNQDTERKKQEEELKREIVEQEKHQREIRDEMRQERETFKNEIEEMRQEKENIKTEKENLQIKYETEIGRLKNVLENERQNYENEKKKRENEYIEREEQYKTQIKEKQREICEEMKTEREEWEKQKKEEKTRREEEDDKRREKELKAWDEFNHRLKQERERMESEKEDLRSKHEVEENKMKVLMEERVEKLNRDLMNKYEEEKERIKMIMKEEQQNNDKEIKRKVEELRERDEIYKREMKIKDEQEREMRENIQREREMFKIEMEEMRLEKKKAKEEKEILKTEYETEIDRLMIRIENERQNQETERKRREEEFLEKEERFKTQIKYKEEREEQMQKMMRELEELEKEKLEQIIRRDEYDKRRETEKQISDEQIQKLQSEMEGIIREKERIERERQGQLEDLEKRLKDETNKREDQQNTFEEKLKLLEEQHEDDIKRRRVEWREEYERQKGGKKCSETSNSLKVAAYRNLETEYSKWYWRLRSAMIEIENKLHNKIENKAIQEVKETDIQRDLKHTSEEVEKSMSEFFENDADLLTQWKTLFEIKIKMLQENIVKETKRKLNEIHQQQDLKKKIDTQRTYHENTLFEKSKELALKLKDQTNNETLKKEFDLFWEQSLKKIIKDTPAIKDIDIMRDAREILSDSYEGHLAVSYFRGSKDIFSMPSYSDYVQVKKTTGFTRLDKDSFRSAKDKLAYNLSREDETEIKSLVIDIVQQTDRMIESFNISELGYNISYIQQLTDYIKARIMKHDKGSDKYEFKKKFFINLVLSVCKRANKKINDQHKMFRDANDPVIYIKKKREEKYGIFKKQLNRAASAAIFGKIICLKLKDPIEQSVYKKTARDLTDEMRSNCKSLKGNRSNLEKHILKTLAEEEDFDKYMNYIHNPRDHFKSFIRDEVSRYITDKFSISVLSKMKENTKLLQQKIMKAAHESTEHVQVNRGDAGLWLKSFTQQLSDVLIFSEKDLSGVKHEDVDDFNLMEEVIRQELFLITFDISSTFNIETFPVKLDYKFRPDEILIDHFCQCCWVQCPFCGATCTNTIEHHDEDHSVPFHRVTGINGTYYPKTQNFCADICTNLVASDEYFYTPNGMFKYRKYKKAKERFETWSISPDLSELPYWKWFVCRFQKQLEKNYSKTFEGNGKIPDQWTKYSKPDAIESLDQCI